MGWARLDDGFHDHPKLIGLSMDAIGLYTVCLTWAHRHKNVLTPGYIPPELPGRFASSKGKRLAETLLQHRLWDAADDGVGWLIHDFVEYLPKERDPEERARAGRKGAAKRWEVTREVDGNLPSDGMAEGMASDGSRASAPAFPTRPVPKKQKTPSSADADAAFAEWWKLYPRKVGKQDARRVWDRKIRDTDPTTIIDGLRRYLPLYAKTEPDFIPHPSTWLHQGRWEDEVEVVDPDEDLPHYWRTAP